MSHAVTVLIVEDDGNITNFMKTILGANDYDVLTAKNGREAMMLITSYCPDLILLDLGLPDTDGLEIIRNVRVWSQMPILVVSARDRERDKVEALDAGADDYITKPFGAPELLARIRAALRQVRLRDAQAGLAPAGKFCTGGLTVDYDKHRVYLDGEDAGLTQNEYKLVALLSKYAGRVLTYDFLMTNLWGPHARGDNQILRVNMANIRRKIEQNPAAPAYLFTEVGVGYRMREPESV
mgnify:CR=1 FL=1